MRHQGASRVPCVLPDLTSSRQSFFPLGSRYIPASQVLRGTFNALQRPLAGKNQLLLRRKFLAGNGSLAISFAHAESGDSPRFGLTRLDETLAISPSSSTSFSRPSAYVTLSRLHARLLIFPGEHAATCASRYIALVTWSINMWTAPRHLPMSASTIW